MRRGGKAAAVALGALAACGGPRAPAEPEIAAEVVSADRYPALAVEFAGGVTGIPGVTFASYPGYRPLELDLYLPPASRTGGRPRPFVVFVHGGGWVQGNRRTTGAFASWPAVLASVAARGYVVASISYRLAGEAPFPAAVQDVKAAVRWLRANAERYHVDDKRGLVWGPSAGGQLAALTALSCGVAFGAPPGRSASLGAASQPALPPPRSESACVQAAVVWYGVSDFSQMPVGPQAVFLACDQPPCATEDIERAASPVNYVDEGDPPILLVHGAADEVVPPQQAQRLYDALRARGVAAELLLLPGIGHNFLGPSPEATRQANLEALRRTVDFIDRSIGPER